MSHWYLDYAYFNSAKCFSSTGMSSGRLSDEVAIVTGAGRNIGQTIAETFAAEGAYVIVADVDKEAATAVADGITDAGGEAVAAATDVTDPSDVAAMIETAEEEFGPVDILINNAVINERKGLFDITIDEFDRTLETNLRGTFLCTREAAKSMKKTVAAESSISLLRRPVMLVVRIKSHMRPPSRVFSILLDQQQKRFQKIIYG